jgi:hypothetical protein
MKSTWSSKQASFDRRMHERVIARSNAPVRRRTRSSFQVLTGWNEFSPRVRPGITIVEFPGVFNASEFKEVKARLRAIQCFPINFGYNADGSVATFSDKQAAKIRLAFDEDEINFPKEVEIKISS